MNRFFRSALFPLVIIVVLVYLASQTLLPGRSEQRKMTYIYPEGDTYVFMNQGTGDQIHVPVEQVGDAKAFLIDGLEVEVMLFNGNPIGVELPAHVIIQVASSEPGIKGDTASGATKPATLVTGATVNVPLFIKEGEWIKIDTSSGQYLERVNK